MNSKIRLESKRLLTHCAPRLFIISFLSFLLRYSLIVIYVWGVALLYKSTFFSALLKVYNEYIVYGISVLLLSITAFFCLLFISGIRLGEGSAYFTRANGGTGSLFTLFRYLKPSRCMKALSLYLQISGLKFLWLIYFFTPAVICAGCIYYLYRSDYIAQSVYIVLSVGLSIILAFAVIMSRVMSLRLSAAPYYMCLQNSITTSKAIKKSIRFTDGFLCDGVVLEYSLTGWLLSCIFIIPAFYVIPYTKLTKAVFITEALFSREASKEPYAINYICLSKAKAEPTM